MFHTRTGFFCLALMISLYSQAQNHKSSWVDRKVYYRVIRNASDNSGLLGITATPVLVDANALNTNFALGLGAFYTYKSAFGISADYRRSYLDNAGGNGQHGNPGRSSSAPLYGFPVKYQKASAFEIITKTTIWSRLKQVGYLESAGKFNGTPSVGVVKAKEMHAITIRLGFQHDNRIIEDKSGSGIPFFTSPETQVPNTELSRGSTMMASNIIVAGIGLTSFMDNKIEFDDPEFHGRKQSRYQTDVFFDLLYASSLSLQDIYYFDNSNKLQQTNVNGTKLTRFGGRFGVQFLTLHSPIGTKVNFELGARPGPARNHVLANAYCQLTVGLAFGGRIAYKAPKQRIPKPIPPAQQIKPVLLPPGL